MTTDFEAWVGFIFDRDVSDPEWFWSPEFDTRWQALEITPAVTVPYLTRLYQEPAVLARFSLEQIAQGIWFLVGESSPAQPSHALLDAAIPLQDRLDCVKAIASFFRDFVAGAAPGSADTETNPFHIACYMWWDIFPTWGGGKAAEPELDQACLEVMAEVLAIPSELCQLSALHGLNHWYLNCAEDVERIVDAFVAGANDLSARVREYAALARRGLAQ